MKLIAAFCTFFALSSAAAEVPACLFDDVLAFGASVTSATTGLAPGLAESTIRIFETYGRLRHGYVKPKDAPARPRPFGLSPVRYLVKHFVGQRGLKRVTYISEPFPNGEPSLGSTQIVNMLSGKSTALFERATLVVGVDAFYWDAISDTCGEDLDAIIRAFILRARDAGKTLILGTVPVEDPAKVRIATEKIGIPLWWPPVESCVNRINAVLDSLCTPANRCYLADVRDAVARLNAGEKLPLRGGGRYGYYEMRPDGVHLSDKGTRYVAEMMIDALAAAPPACAEPLDH